MAFQTSWHTYSAAGTAATRSHPHPDCLRAIDQQAHGRVRSQCPKSLGETVRQMGKPEACLITLYRLHQFDSSRSQKRLGRSCTRVVHLDAKRLNRGCAWAGKETSRGATDIAT